MGQAESDSRHSQSDDGDTSLLVRIDKCWDLIRNSLRNGEAIDVSHLCESIAGLTAPQKRRFLDELLKSIVEEFVDEATIETCALDGLREALASPFEEFRWLINSSLVPRTEPAFTKIDKYKIVRRIGGGGMGTVYEAVNPDVGRTVALKVCHGPEFAERFHREMNFAGQLEHDNLITSFDGGTTSDGRLFYVMPYLRGRNLAEIVSPVNKTRPRIKLEDACEIIRQVAKGLQFAREQVPGLVHRDIKPANLMLTVEAGEARVKILDLGVAGFDDAHALTEPGICGGTLAYMAPEQRVELRNADERSDIYSLGCTLHFLLTGEPPKNDSSSVLRQQVAAGGQVVHPGLLAVYSRMIAQGPHDRFQTLEEVAIALEPLASGFDLATLLEMCDSLETGVPKVSVLATNEGDPPTARRSRLTAIMGLIVVVAAIGAAWLASVTWPRLAGAPTQVPPNSPNANPDDTGIASRRVAIGCLPGLTGAWWFEEVPWLTPTVRLHLSSELNDMQSSRIHETCLSSDVDMAHDMLFELSDRSLAKLSEVHRRQVAALTDVQAAEDEGQRYQRLLQVPTVPGKNPADLHFTAVRSHCLALYSENSGEADKHWTAANSAYVQALEEYPLNHSADVNCLRLLCLADYRRLQYDTLTRSIELSNSVDRESMKNLQSTSEVLWRAVDKFAPDVNRVGLGVFIAAESGLDCQVMQSLRHDPGVALTRVRQALESLSESNEVGAASMSTRHPLRAYVYERAAWLLLDLGAPQSARELFHFAGVIHQANRHRVTGSEANETTSEYCTQRAQIGWVDCARGEAVADSANDAFSEARIILKNLLATDLDEQSLLNSMISASHRSALCERYLRTAMREVEVEMLSQDGDASAALRLLGVALNDSANDNSSYNGLKVVRVQPGSSGEKVTFQGQQFKIDVGDYILAIDGRRMQSVRDFTSMVDGLSQEAEVSLRVKDGTSGKTYDALVKLDQHEQMRLGITVEQGGAASVARWVKNSVQTRASLVFFLGSAISEHGLDPRHLGQAQEILANAEQAGERSAYYGTLEAVLSLEQMPSQNDSAFSALSERLKELSEVSATAWISVDNRLALKILKRYLEQYEQPLAIQCLSTIDRLLESRHPDANLGESLTADLGDSPNTGG